MTHRYTHKHVNDSDIMTANEAGMNAYDEGQSVHDNPYSSVTLREAWSEGWYAGYRAAQTNKS